MNLDKVIFGFFIVLALTLNLAFVIGPIDNPDNHNVWILFATIVVNLIATILKFGDRSQIGALLLATGLVADLQLVVCASIWTIAVYGTQSGLSATALASIVSIASGALAANFVSVTLVVADTLASRR
ncbi:MAG: DUF6394 family protein [Proteobacteria bacterium]|nr:DUF6394 family protein [Pseudomonadota bacterium]